MGVTFVLPLSLQIGSRLWNHFWILCCHFTAVYEAKIELPKDTKTPSCFLITIMSYTHMMPLQMIWRLVYLLRWAAVPLSSASGLQRVGLLDCWAWRGAGLMQSQSWLWQAPASVPFFRLTAEVSLNWSFVRKSKLVISFWPFSLCMPADGSANAQGICRCWLPFRQTLPFWRGCRPFCIIKRSSTILA